MLKFDKEKYLRIMKSQGYQAALTTLHRDTEHFEFETFEGEKGYQRPMWEELEEVRRFSRELWDQAIAEGATRQS